MNTNARINANGIRTEITNPGCGFTAMRNVERAFWQSRMTVDGQRAEPPQLVEIESLATEVRRTYPKDVL